MDIYWLRDDDAELERQRKKRKMVESSDMVSKLRKKIKILMENTILPLKIMYSVKEEEGKKQTTEEIEFIPVVNEKIESDDDGICNRFTNSHLPLKIMSQRRKRLEEEIDFIPVVDSSEKFEQIESDDIRPKLKCCEIGGRFDKVRRRRNRVKKTQQEHEESLANGYDAQGTDSSSSPQEEIGDNFSEMHKIMGVMMEEGDALSVFHA